MSELYWLLQYIPLPGLHLWERHTAGVGNTKRTWKTAIRNRWKSRLGQMDKMVFQQGKIIPTAFSAPSAGAMVPPPPILLGPPHAGMRPGTCSWNETTYERPHANDAEASDDGTSSSAHDGTHLARNDSPRQLRREGSLFLLISVLYSLFYFTRRSWGSDVGCFLTASQGRLAPLSYRREKS